jgi:hypothetical protein
MVLEDINPVKKWEAVYHRAVLEVDGKKMPELIAAARQAIEERLQGLAGNPNHHAERQQVEDALRALTVLEWEAKHWLEN